MNFCDFPWWLAWLLPFLLGLLLGWLLWARWKKRFEEMEGKYNASLKTNSGLEGNLKDCNHDKAVLEGDLATAHGMVKEMKVKVSDAEQAVKNAEAAADKASTGSGTNLTGAVSGFAAGAVTGAGIGKDKPKAEKPADEPKEAPKKSSGASGAFASLKSDNLQIIEGIGPKMESVLHDAGIKDWSTLSTKSADELRGILDGHGDKYKIINPTSWSEQAHLAAGGKWDELILLQKQLDGGNATNVNLTDSKLEKLMAKHMKGGFGKFKENDLKIVEGIGPKIAELLNNAGITTWAGLADTPVDKIQSVLDEHGSKFKLAVPRTWPQQAGLAAAGKWNELKELQDKLDGGK